MADHASLFSKMSSSGQDLDGDPDYLVARSIDKPLIPFLQSRSSLEPPGQAPPSVVIDIPSWGAVRRVVGDRCRSRSEAFPHREAAYLAPRPIAGKPNRTGEPGWLSIFPGRRRHPATPRNEPLGKGVAGNTHSPRSDGDASFPRGLLLDHCRP